MHSGVLTNFLIWVLQQPAEQTLFLCAFHVSGDNQTASVEYESRKAGGVPPIAHDSCLPLLA